MRCRFQRGGCREVEKVQVRLELIERTNRGGSTWKKDHKKGELSSTLDYFCLPFPLYLAIEFPILGLVGFGTCGMQPNGSNCEGSRRRGGGAPQTCSIYHFTAQRSSHLRPWLGTANGFYQNVSHLLQIQAWMYGIHHDLAVLLISRTQSLINRSSSSVTCHSSNTSSSSD